MDPQTWKLEIKKEAYIYPCPKGFFVVEFDLANDREQILIFDPWFWGKERLYTKLWTPTFVLIVDTLHNSSLVKNA
jgi:hypothetical protein